MTFILRYKFSGNVKYAVTMCSFTIRYNRWCNLSSGTAAINSLDQ